MSGASFEELQAAHAAAQAAAALIKAIGAYEKAGFGSYVTQPLRDALLQVEFSMREVKS